MWEGCVGETERETVRLSRAPPLLPPPPPPARCAVAELKADSRGQRTVLIAAKVFADAPRQQGAQPGSRSLEHGSQEGQLLLVSSKSDFIFSDVTATRYKEYNVVKVNKRGVRQERSSMRRSSSSISSSSTSNLLVVSPSCCCCCCCYYC